MVNLNHTTIKMNQDQKNVCEIYEDQHSITKGTFLYSRFF